MISRSQLKAYNCLTLLMLEHLKLYKSPGSWGFRIHQLHLCRGVRISAPTTVSDMALSNLIVRLH